MRRINWKKPAAVAAALALSTALLAGCGSTAASSDSVAESTAVSESTAEEAEEGDADEVAAKNCADLIDRKSTRLNSSHLKLSRMPSSA